MTDWQSAHSRDNSAESGGAQSSVARPPGFAVIGTGRSGTAYVAAVLRACGVDCGHEDWWTPFPAKRRSGLAGDSSWLALPDIESGAWTGPVLHVTRHPVHVVRSLLANGFFSNHKRRRDFIDFALAHEPDLVHMSEFEASVEWWARWNLRCEAVADLRLKVSDIPARLDLVGKLINHRLDMRAAQSVPADVNHRQKRGPVQIDEDRVWRLLAGRAERFGYHK